MQNNKMAIGVLIGALVGGLITLFDKKTRTATKTQCKNAKNKTNYYVKHPSEAIKNARIACNQFNDTFNKSADSAINALEQVETTIDQLTNKEESRKEIETVG